MTVNLNRDDKTWITHLDGFLAILRTQGPSNNTTFSSLIHASQLVCQGHDAQMTPADDRATTRSIMLLMDVAKLRLRQLIIDLNRMTQSKISGRHIDKQRVLVGLKSVQRDALLITSTSVIDRMSVRITDQNTFRAIVIITADLIIQIGTHLETKRPFQSTRAYTKQRRSISEAVDAICDSSVRMFPDENENTNTFSAISRFGPAVINGVFAVWPLHAAAVAYGINEDTRRRIRAMLWRVGTLVKIPIAMSLVSSNTNFPFHSS